MINKKLKPTSITRLFIYVSPIIFFILLVLIDLNFSGTRIFQYDIGKDSAVISQLYPEQRLEGVHSRKQRIVSQPIYFNVLYPHRYDTAVVTIDAENVYYKDWKIGIQRIDDNDWKYDLYEPDEKGTASISLENARVIDRQIRFIIAIDELDNIKMYISRIEVTLKRNSLF